MMACVAFHDMCQDSYETFDSFCARIHDPGSDANTILNASVAQQMLISQGMSLPEALQIARSN